MSRRRNGLRKQVAKENGHLELRRKRKMSRERGWGKVRLYSIDRAALGLEVSGENPVEYSSAFLVCPFKVMVSTNW